MLLQSFDQFDLLVELTDAAGRSPVFSQKREPDRAMQQTCGQFCFVENHFVAFYSREAALHFQLESAVWRLSTSAKTRLWTRDEQRIFSLEDAGQSLIEVAHSAPIFEIAPYDFTQIEAEDFDFLLWVHHVVTSPERQSILLKNGRDC